MQCHIPPSLVPQPCSITRSRRPPPAPVVPSEALVIEGHVVAVHHDVGLIADLQGTKKRCSQQAGMQRMSGRGYTTRWQAACGGASRAGRVQQACRLPAQEGAPHLVFYWVGCVALDPAPVVGGLVALRVLRHVEAKDDVPPGRGDGQQGQVRAAREGTGASGVSMCWPRERCRAGHRVEHGQGCCKQCLY